MNPIHFIQVDLPAVLAALFAACACALLGNFLVLRRQSLMSDAISHAVLPGIVIAFMLAGTRATAAMFAGAALAAFVTVISISFIKRYARLEAGAAMGVVFSIMFAAGVVLIELGGARNVDLDADCVLYGQLEHILWLAPKTFASLRDPLVWLDMPRQVTTLAATFVMTLLAVSLFWKELKIASFDPQLATSLGFSAGRIDMGLMFFVGLVAVAAFESVGSILVIAMFICPAAAARVLTERLVTQVWLSQALAAVSAIAGYLLAAFGPGVFGSSSSLVASGMIALISGIILAAAVLWGGRSSRRLASGRAQEGASVSA
ncbi:MAG: metal ABC transporter permease [Beijerinckiaceae bacterium]|nr:metal ABC transporter permease [Beijerinckiaceae bacterium]